MLVSVAQLECQLGDTAANVAHLRRWARAARDAGADVVVFPEMMDTGYDMKVVARTASAWDEGAFPAIRDMALEFELHVICGLSERSTSGIHNAVAVIAPNGELLLKYRKVHLFTGEPVHEERHLVPGDRLGMVEFGGLRWGVMVCYDIRFPELARAMALAGIEAIAIPSAFPLPRLRHWTTLLAARAIENQVYVCAANRVGTDGAVTFCGASRILDPNGVVTAAAPEVGETLINARIDRDVLARTRASQRVFDDRVPSAYDATPFTPQPGPGG